jgi:long-chain acyl-CoA synthetase
MTVQKGKGLGEVKRETLNHLFWSTVERYPDIVAIRYRADDHYKGISYRELGEKVRALAAGLLSLGLQKGDKVSLLSETRWEWALADFAILTAAGVTVTVYPTLSARTVQFIVDNSDSRIIIVEDEIQLEKVLSVRTELPALEHILVIEGPADKPKEPVLTLKEVMEMGHRFDTSHPTRYESAWRSVEPADLSSIVYTSGTTGLPKGAMLSHWNWRFNVYAVVGLVVFNPGDTLLAFLPMAHVYMRLVYFAAVAAAATTYFSRPENLAQDLPAIRPNAFVSVPRLFERVYGRLVDQVNSGPSLRKKIFYWAAGIAREVGETQSRWQKPGAFLKFKHQLADRLVYSKIRTKMGVDRLGWTCSAGAALRRDLAFFFNGMGITIIEGFGMTEVAAPSNLNPVGRFKPGTVGPPVPGVAQKIAADGEILIKGDNVMMGYYKLPEETAACFTEDGWLKTGDVGEFDADGYLVFKERKKHILVLSTGKNVAPLPIEEELKKSRWIDEAVVIGDNEKFIAALIQPNFQQLLELAREKNLQYDKGLTKIVKAPTGEAIPVRVDEGLLRNSAIQELFQQVVDEANRVFDPHEQVKQFRLLGEALTLEKEELTPTMKIRKKVIQEKYQNLIEQIYV